MRRILGAFLIPGLVATGVLSLATACATPAACRSVCEDPESKNCKQCLEQEREKREEQRRERAERERQQAPTYPGGGGMPGGY